MNKIYSLWLLTMMMKQIEKWNLEKQLRNSPLLLSMKREVISLIMSPLKRETVLQTLQRAIAVLPHL